MPAETGHAASLEVWLVKVTVINFLNTLLQMLLTYLYIINNIRHVQ